MRVPCVPCFGRGSCRCTRCNGTGRVGRFGTGDVGLVVCSGCGGYRNITCVACGGRGWVGETFEGPVSAGGMGHVDPSPAPAGGPLQGRWMSQGGFFEITGEGPQYAFAEFGVIGRVG